MAMYITRAGYEALARELDTLWRDERPRVTAEVEAAAALGDRSENAEYIYGKRRLRQIDSRLRFLKKRLDALTVVDEVPANRERVFFGAYVTVEDDEGDVHRYRLVGADEIDPDRGWISMASPMGRALLGKGLDDEVTVRRPAGDAGFTVVAIDYEG
ncbi:MAG: transcription elongation factor GreB [Myxococcota bacterium]